MIGIEIGWIHGLLSNNALIIYVAVHPDSPMPLRLMHCIQYSGQTRAPPPIIPQLRQLLITPLSQTTQSRPHFQITNCLLIIAPNPLLQFAFESQYRDNSKVGDNKGIIQPLPATNHSIPGPIDTV